MQHNLYFATFINHCYFCGKEYRKILPLAYRERDKDGNKL